MTFAERARRWLGFGVGPSDGGHSDKNFRDGEFSQSAKRTRDAFVAYKQKHPEVKKVDDMTPLERRMQSGSI